MDARSHERGVNRIPLILNVPATKGHNGILNAVTAVQRYSKGGGREEPRLRLLAQAGPATTTQQAVRGSATNITRIAVVTRLACRGSDGSAAGHLAVCQVSSPVKDNIGVCG